MCGCYEWSLALGPKWGQISMGKRQIIAPAGQYRSMATAWLLVRFIMAQLPTINKGMCGCMNGREHLDKTRRRYRWGRGRRSVGLFGIPRWQSLGYWCTPKQPNTSLKCGSCAGLSMVGERLDTTRRRYRWGRGRRSVGLFGIARCFTTPRYWCDSIILM